MVAGKAADKSMFDHPARTIGALKTMPASPAQGERRKAAPVEKEQALFAAFDSFFKRL
jgi:hypothetical protein